MIPILQNFLPIGTSYAIGYIAASAIGDLAFPDMRSPWTLKAGASVLGVGYDILAAVM
jgi:hypothetical protein